MMKKTFLKTISLFAVLIIMIVNSMMILAQSQSPLALIKAEDIKVVNATEDRLDVYYAGDAFGGLHNLSLVKDKTDDGYCYKIVITENNHEICHWVVNKDIKLNTQGSLREFKANII